MWHHSSPSPVGHVMAAKKLAWATLKRSPMRPGGQKSALIIRKLPNSNKQSLVDGDWWSPIIMCKVMKHSFFVVYPGTRGKTYPTSSRQRVCRGRIITSSTGSIPDPMPGEAPRCPPRKQSSVRLSLTKKPCFIPGLDQYPICPTRRCFGPWRYVGARQYLVTV